VLVVLATAVVLPSASTSAKTNPKVELTTDQLNAALLALEDMPPGWAAQQRSPAVDRTSTTGGVCNGPNALLRAQMSGVLAHAYSTFSQDPSTGPLIGEAIYVFPAGHHARQFVDAAKHQVAACTTGWQAPSLVNPAITWQYSVSPLSFTKLGDDTYAWRQVGTSQSPGTPGPSLTMDLVYVAEGNNAVVVARDATSSVGAASTDVDQLQQYSQKARSKLAVALAAAKEKTTATTTTPTGTRKPK
jgi:hypothetical protein